MVALIEIGFDQKSAEDGSVVGQLTLQGPEQTQPDRFSV
jgi:hypothetical protein